MTRVPAPGEDAVKIVPAVSESERAAVFALRYDVVAREQRIAADPAMDHSRGTVIDPADATGVIFTAWSDGVLAGAARANLLRDGPATPYCTVLGLAGLPEHERRLVSVSSRLVVDARWRKMSLGIRLAQACYRHYHAAGVAWDHVIARPEMVPFFLRLGYVPMALRTEFPGVGPMTPLRLNLDLAYLRHVGSILLPDSVRPSNLVGRATGLKAPSA